MSGTGDRTEQNQVLPYGANISVEKTDKKQIRKMSDVICARGREIKNARFRAGVGRAGLSKELCLSRDPGEVRM